ncbi:hypothetical protein GGI43DRAFT_394534 [Trichoderma evansii]
MLNIPLPLSSHSVLASLIGLLVLKARPVCLHVCKSTPTSPISSPPRECRCSSMGLIDAARAPPRRHRPGNRSCKSIRGVALLFLSVNAPSSRYPLPLCASSRGGG